MRKFILSIRNHKECLKAQGLNEWKKKNLFSFYKLWFLRETILVIGVPCVVQMRGFSCYVLFPRYLCKEFNVMEIVEKEKIYNLWKFLARNYCQ